MTNATAATILIVDDDIKSRKLLEELLRHEGYLTTNAANGEEALGSVAKRTPDLILLDVMLPGMDGYQVARVLKANPVTSNIPIIMVTAQLDRSARLEGLKAGAEEFLTKPVDRAELWLRVRNLLRLKAYGDFLQNHSAILEQQVQARTADLLRFRRAMDATADAITLVDRATMRFVEVNAAASHMLGYTREELLGMGPAQLGHATTEQMENTYDAIIMGQAAGRLQQIQLQRKDGSRFQVEIHRHAQRSGVDWIVVSVLRDVTERNRVQAALTESEARFRQISDNIRDVFFLIDAGDQKTIYISPAFDEIWGTSCASAYANPASWSDALHPSDRERIAETYARDGKTGRFDMEYRIVRPDGSIRWIHTRGFPVRDEKGNLHRIAGIAEDITQQKRTSEELRESERRLGDMLDNVQMVSVMLDREARITYCNDYLLEVTGWKREEVLGGSWLELFVPPDATHMKDVFADLVADRPAAWHYEDEIVTRTGGRRLIRWDNTVLRSANGDVIGTASLGKDITERREAEKRMHEANSANEAKSTFLATMSHEIRTPMNGVIGMADVLQQTSLNDSQVEMVDLIRQSAFSLLTIIDDILDFSKIEAGGVEIERVPISIADVMERACGLLDHVALNKGVEFTLFIDPTIPEAVLGDELRLRQVMLNLVSNAIKFSSGRKQAGKISVRVVSIEHSPAQVTVDIEVADNGIGMDEETQARLFSAFSQGDASTTRRFGGTGLGLVISRRLVELMGGELTLQSTPDKGSAFTVRLPFARSQSDAPVVKPPSEIAGLSCLVVGGPGGLAENIAAYLTHDGTRTERAAELSGARTMMLELPPGSWIWIIDAADIHIPIDQLHDLARSLPEYEIRFVVIGRGSRREPHAQYADVVLMDGNVLTRRRLRRTVAIAAGRAREEANTPLSRKHEAPFKPPSHDDALRNGRLILVAEDNETNRKVIVRQLALLGYAADVADNGRLALQLWQSGNYALLLTDLQMPQMDGYELTAAIRALEPGPARIPIVALTANTLKGEADHCRAIGMDDYLSKPFQLANLAATLDAWVPAAVSAMRTDEARGQDRAKPVDVSVLENLVGDDPEVIRSLLSDFQLSTINIADALLSACAQGHPMRVIEQAHKLKSSARSVGALALGQLCEEMETAGNAEGGAEALESLLPMFEKELDAVSAFLDSFQAQPADRRPDK